MALSVGTAHTEAGTAGAESAIGADVILNVRIAISTRIAVGAESTTMLESLLVPGPLEAPR